jgi:hypothetical protein
MHKKKAVHRKTEPDRKTLLRSERLRLYLGLTGLGRYPKKNVADWYDTFTGGDPP